MSARGWLGVVLVLLMLGGAGLAFFRAEGTPPALIAPPSLSVGAKGIDVEIAASDSGSGIRELSAVFSHAGGDREVALQSYPGSLLRGGDAGADRSLTLHLDPKQLGSAEGDGFLRISARDWSWRGGFGGNQTRLEVPVKIDLTPPRLAIAIGALGPQMRHLAATHAQGVALNWCTPEQITIDRAQVGPETRLIEYIRVCVDDDVPAARLALAKQILAYALMPRGSGSRGYPAHFERMGFGPELAELNAQRAKGATDEVLARTMPERLIDTFGCYGSGEGAREKFAAMAAGLDLAIVRVLSPRPGDLVPVRRAMEALAP